MFGFMDTNMTWFHGFGFFFFWIVIFLVIAFFIFGSKNTNQKESALDILNKRLARGDISQEEYDKVKEKITNS